MLESLHIDVHRPTGRRFVVTILSPHEASPDRPHPHGCAPGPGRTIPIGTRVVSLGLAVVLAAAVQPRAVVRADPPAGREATVEGRVAALKGSDAKARAEAA